MGTKGFPSFLASVDREGDRVFVLATPNLSAVKTNGVWKYCEPLSDEEIKKFELVTDLKIASYYVEQARQALGIF